MNQEPNPLSNIQLGVSIDSATASEISLEALRTLGYVHMTVNSASGHDNILDTIDNAVEKLRQQVSQFGKWIYVQGKRIRLDPDSPASVANLRETLVATPRARVTGSLRGGAPVAEAPTSLKDLRKLAGAQKVKGFSRMSRDQLLAALDSSKSVSNPSSKVLSKSPSKKPSKKAAAKGIQSVLPMDGGKLAAVCVYSDEPPQDHGSEFAAITVCVRPAKGSQGVEVVARTHSHLLKRYQAEIASVLLSNIEA